VDISRKAISITLLVLGGVLIVYVALLAGMTPDAGARAQGSVDEDTSDLKAGETTVSETTVSETTVGSLGSMTVGSEALLTGKVKKKTNDSNPKYVLKRRRGSNVKLETKNQDEQLLDQYVGKSVKVKGKLTTSEGKGKSKRKKLLEVESIVEKDRSPTPKHHDAPSRGH